jgi:tetratricopeptide (TPR) repeat protein
MMLQTIACPACCRTLQVPAGVASQQVRCASCKVNFWINAAADELPTASLSPTAPAAAMPAGQSPSRSFRDDYGLDVGSGSQPVPAPAPPRRSAPVLAPKKQDNPRVSRVVLGVVLGGVASGLVLVLMMVGLSMDTSPAPQGTSSYVPANPVPNDARHPKEEVKPLPAVPVLQQPLSEEEMRRELKPFFQSLAEAVNKQDEAAFASHLSPERLLDEVLTLPNLPNAPFGDRQTAIEALRLGMRQKLAQNDPQLQWTSCDIHHVKKLAAQEAAVIVRHGLANSQAVCVRWWLSKRTGVWKIFDIETLDLSLRFVTVTAGILELRQDELPAMKQAMPILIEAIRAVYQNLDADLAERKLQSIAAVKLPRIAEGLRSYGMALVHLQRGQGAAALEAVNKALDFYPDRPVLHLAKGVAHNQLGQWKQALHCLDTYQEFLGDDWLESFARGDALNGLQRFADAAAAYRRSLDANPKNASAFQKLLAILRPKDLKDDLGARFAKLDRPQQNFETFAWSCSLTRDSEALEQLSLAMQNIDPTYAQADFYLALAKAWAAQVDEALVWFGSALRKQTDAGKRQEYIAQFMTAIAPTGGAVRAYAAAPDQRAAFAVLAAQLKLASRTDDLRNLLAVHAGRHPNDPQLALYRDEMPAKDRMLRRPRDVERRLPPRRILR